MTELDVSDNGITSLEITSLAALRSLKCSNNAIVTVSLHGATLQSFIAENNSKSVCRKANAVSRAMNCNALNNTPLEDKRLSYFFPGQIRLRV